LIQNTQGPENPTLTDWISEGEEKFWVAAKDEELLDNMDCGNQEEDPGMEEGEGVREDRYGSVAVRRKENKKKKFASEFCQSV
jgi:hypothetical protein